MRSGSRTGVVTVIAAMLAVWLACAGAALAEPPGENPAPNINSLSPTAAATGGPEFTLAVTGLGFVAGSQVYWNGEARPTVFVSTTQVQAQIAAGDIAVEQTAAITVFNPAPGGGTSPAAGFRVAPPSPVPEVTGLSPAQALAGDVAFGITVIGGGFVPGSTVLWNGEDRATGYVNAFMLAATIRASDVAAAGTAYVSVVNPAPGGGQSLEARIFTIVHPAPTLEGLAPASVWAGSSSFTLAVSGSRFAPGSVIQVAGVDLPTTFVSAQRLEAPVPAAAIAYAGSPSVRVFTPAPGGGLSEPVFLAVEDDPYPPETSVSGLTGVWHSRAVAFTLVATDVGRGVLRTFYRVGETGEYANGTTVRLPAPANHARDGMHVVRFYSVDEALNWEQPKQVSVGIDTRPPKTYAVSGSVKRGATLRLRYRVDDALSPRALDATLRVTNKAGKVVLRCSLGRPPTRAWRTGTGCTVTLPRGTYTMRVLAHDLAGNAQSGTRSATLKVY